MRENTPDGFGPGDLERSRRSSILWHGGTYRSPVQEIEIEIVQ